MQSCMLLQNNFLAIHDEYAFGVTTVANLLSQEVVDLLLGRCSLDSIDTGGTVFHEDGDMVTIHEVTNLCIVVSVEADRLVVEVDAFDGFLVTDGLDHDLVAVIIRQFYFPVRRWPSTSQCHSRSRSNGRW